MLPHPPVFLERCYRTVFSALILTAFGCSDGGNTGKRAVPEGVLESIPWVSGEQPRLDESGSVELPPEPAYPAIATGQIDPGSRAVDCSVTEPYEFAEAWIERFEPPAASSPDTIGAAPAWASYGDDTKGSFYAPGFLSWYPGLAGRYVALWGLPADSITDGPECDGQDNSWALHYRGGPFNRFGGGVNHPLALLNRCPEGADFCTPIPEPNDEVDSVGLPTRPAEDRDYAQPHTYWDLSNYDGIAFWARRGPEGVSHMQVTLMDKFTSDDLARENQKFCKRLRPCRTECQNGAPCSPVYPGVSGTEHRCFDPDDGEIPVVADDGLLDELYPRCGESACTSPSNFVDHDFDGGQCRPYTFDNHESGEFCFSPDGDPPPDRDERCGDGHSRIVWLNPDWTFYAIPFSELRQLNFGKPAPYLDLKSAAWLTFAFPMGWVDAYIDNVTFYRNKE